MEPLISTEVDSPIALSVVRVLSLRVLHLHGLHLRHLLLLHHGLAEELLLRLRVAKLLLMRGHLLLVAKRTKLINLVAHQLLGSCSSVLLVHQLLLLEQGLLLLQGVLLLLQAGLHTVGHVHIGNVG